MSGVDECADVRRELGVYVLGAISPVGRARVIRHLAWCPGCREDVAGLAGLPALLRRPPAAAAAQLVPDVPAGHGSDPPVPAMGLDTLLIRVAGVRRRRRWRLAAAAVAVAVAGAGAGWGLQFQRSAAPEWAAAAEGFNPATRAWAAVRYTGQPWGTELEASVGGIPAGTTCQMWVTGRRGQQVAAGGWTIVGTQPHAWYPASVSLPVTGLHAFEVTAGGKILVTVAVR